jgi:hypothetical protein
VSEEVASRLLDRLAGPDGLTAQASTFTRPDVPATPASRAARHVACSNMQGQAAVIDTVRIWTSVTDQLTHIFRLPVPDVDLVGIVDRTFDLAEQALAAQHQLARTLAGVVTRQVAPRPRPPALRWRPSKPPSTSASAESRTSPTPPRRSGSS